jgi:hypothetical protein
MSKLCMPTKNIYHCGRRTQGATYYFVCVCVSHGYALSCLILLFGFGFDACLICVRADWHVSDCVHVCCFPCMACCCLLVSTCLSNQSVSTTGFSVNTSFWFVQKCVGRGVQGVHIVQMTQLGTTGRMLEIDETAGWSHWLSV